MTAKTCLDCRETKPLTGFSRNRRKPDGFDIYCKTCAQIQAAAGRRKHPERAAAYCKAWRDRNPGAQAASYRRWYEKNRETVLEKSRQQRLANVDDYLRRARESHARNAAVRNGRQREWRKENPARVRMYTAERRAAKALRTPPWLDDGHRLVILWFYEAAQLLTESTGVLHHVDHVVPLRGKTVSGLHVPWNLQCLPWRKNISKSNRVDL